MGQKKSNKTRGRKNTQQKTNRFHTLAESLLAERMAVLSELKHTVRTSVRWPGWFNLLTAVGSQFFSLRSMVHDCRTLFVRRETTCKEAE